MSRLNQVRRPSERTPFKKQIHYIYMYLYSIVCDDVEKPSKSRKFDSGVVPCFASTVA
jgi:hypothetical protein